MLCVWGGEQEAQGDHLGMFFPVIVLGHHLLSAGMGFVVNMWTAGTWRVLEQPEHS